jgi:hypothetical protein
VEHWGEVANHLEAEQMRIEDGDFGNAIDVNRPAIVDAVTSYDGGAGSAFAVEEDVSVFCQAEIRGKEHPLTKVSRDHSKQQE